MRGEAIVAVIDRGHGDRDHLPVELRQPRFAQHQIVVHVGEGAQLLLVEGVGEKHVRHEAELLLTFGEIGLRGL
jgi:hypothetical protein